MNALLREVELRPQVGFVGAGRSGRAHLRALLDADGVDIAAIADPQPSARGMAEALAPGARCAGALGALLDLPGGLDGVVIATPTNTHFGQAMVAVERGMSVFCRMPLTRTAAEAAQLVGAARRNDCLLATDAIHRFVPGATALRDMIRGGDLGSLYAIDLKFHSAFGPEQPWIYNVTKSGGGCVMDLGSRALDFALWASGASACEPVDAQLYARGRRIERPQESIEDYATVHCRTALGASLRLCCSWHLPAGVEAVFEASFYGTRGGAVLRNINGSDHEFCVEHLVGPRTRRLAAPAGDCRQRPLLAWAERLANADGFDPDAQILVNVATLLDTIYGR